MQFLGPIVSLLLVFGIIVGIIAAVRGRSGEGLGRSAEDAGMGSVKRLYFYGVSFVALLVAANGVSFLLRALVERLLPGGLIRGTSIEQLSLGLALTIVATPLWLVHWTYVQRQVQKEPVEVRSVLRKLYFYLVLMIGMALVVVAAIGLLRWAFRLEPFPSFRTSSLAVWACLWLYHWRLESREGQPTADTQTVRRWYVYLTATYGLWLAVTGAGFALHLVLRYGYDALFSAQLLRPGPGLWSEGMKTSMAIAIVGNVVWVYHWLRAARGDVESTLRQVYLNIFALLPGIVTVLGSLTVALFAALDWGLGGATAPSAAAHFRMMPSALAAVAVSLALWGYHWSVTEREAAHVAGRLQGAQRAYSYIMAGLALASVVGGIITLVATLVGFPALSGQALLASRPGWWRGPLALALTLLVIGVPLYAYFWRSIQRRVASLGREEQSSLSRRTLVYVALGLAMLGLLGGPSHALYLFLRGLLEGNLSVAILREARWSIGVVVAAAVVFPYYWQVLREDRQAGAEERRTRKAVTVVAGQIAQGLVPQIEAALGQRVHFIRALEPDAGISALSSEALVAVAERVSAAPGRNILLLLADGQFHIASYD
jgi:hypothetical protein